MVFTGNCWLVTFGWSDIAVATAWYYGSGSVWFPRTFLPASSLFTGFRGFFLYMAKSETQGNADLALVKKVQQGDSRSFDLLVLKYQHRVMSIVSRFVNDQAEAQDVSQETFIKAYRAINNFRGDSAFYTWLYRIAVNTAKNHLMAKKRRPGSDYQIDDDESSADVVELLQDNESPEASLTREELKGVVNSALDSLSEELKTAITLREFDGFSYEEIAGILDCPVGTVRSRIFRAREVIDKHVRDFMQFN
jgi:RNA polymerase sigma-70 factor (ECF subfamily)